MAEIVGAYMAEAGAVACRGKAFANRRVRVVAMDMIKGPMDKVACRKRAVTAAATGTIELTWPMAAVTVAYIVGQTVVDTWGE